MSLKNLLRMHDLTLQNLCRLLCLCCLQLVCLSSLHSLNMRCLGCCHGLCDLRWMMNCGHRLHLRNLHLGCLRSSEHLIRSLLMLSRKLLLLCKLCLHLCQCVLSGRRSCSHVVCRSWLYRAGGARGLDRRCR